MQRFMLLGTARTGSNFLSSLLSAHPAIKMYGELFNLDTLPRKSLVEALADPLAYLRARVYREHRPEIAITGFKMFYEHLRTDYFTKLIDVSDGVERLRHRATELTRYIDAHHDWTALHERFKATWDFLIADRDLKVVHLRRRNVLHTLLSLKIAVVTGQFWSLANGQENRTTVRLAPEECQRYFEKLDALAKEAEVAFGSHPTLEVFYEDVVADRDAELERVFGFLEVPAAPVATRMKKQISAPPSELLENYDELRAWFRGTRWSGAFD